MSWVMPCSARSTITSNASIVSLERPLLSKLSTARSNNASWSTSYISLLPFNLSSFIIDGYRAIFFREGYGHEPLYHYLATPFQLLLGDNFLSIRLPAAFLGLLLVALTMRWSKRTFNRTTAITAGLLLAVSWQPVIFSRIGIRPILEPVLLLLMAWFWPRRPYLAGLFLGLTLYSYTGARVLFLMPLLWMGYWLINRRSAVPSWKAGAGRPRQQT